MFSRRLLHGRSLTVVFVRDGGRGSWSLALPRWMPAGLRSLALAALYFASLIGFQLQALHGLYGPHVELAVLDGVKERWAGFTRMAPTIVGPTRAELMLEVAHTRALRLGLGTRHAASLLWSGTVEPAWRAEMWRGPNADGTLLWPVRQGVFGRGFGSGSNGYHLAVDIDGPSGSTVMAAAPGIVGYVGHELRGYGNLVLLMHPGGWVTLYGHNKQTLVVPGQRVERGDAIALLGSTGRSMGPHVHFELLHDERNCDPLPLFRFGRHARPARLPDTPLAIWLPDHTRPSAVRCARRKDHPHPSHDLMDPEIAPEGGDGEGGDDNLNAAGHDDVGPMALVTPS